MFELLGQGIHLVLLGNINHLGFNTLKRGEYQEPERSFPEVKQYVSSVMGLPNTAERGMKIGLKRPLAFEIG